MITLQMLDETIVPMKTASNSDRNVRCFSIQPYTPYVPTDVSFSEYPITIKPKVLQVLGVSLAAAIQNIKNKYNTLPVVAFIGTSGAATAAVIGQQDLDLCTFMHINKDGDSSNSHRQGVRIGEQIQVLECPVHFVLTDEHVSSGATLAGVIFKVVKWYRSQVLTQHSSKCWRVNPGEKAPEVSQQQLWDNLHIHIAVPTTCSSPIEILDAICTQLRWRNEVTPELCDQIQKRIVSFSAICEPQLNVKEISEKIKTSQSIPNKKVRGTISSWFDTQLTGISKTVNFLNGLDSRNPLW